MKHLAVVSVLLLGACSDDEFEFRGYSNSASCNEVIAAEKVYGTVTGTRIEEVPRLGRTEITELSGGLFDRPATVSVACFSSGVVNVSYVLADLPGAAPAFDALSVELTKLFGPWSEKQGTKGRIRTFLCGNPATVRLVEESGKSPAQAMLLVTPRRGVC